MSESDEMIIKGFKHVKLDHQDYTDQEMLQRSSDYFEWLDKRRSVREFSDQDIPKQGCHCVDPFQKLRHLPM